MPRPPRLRVTPTSPLTLPRAPLSRLRAGGLMAALAGVVLTLPGVLAGPGVALPVRLATAAALLGLAVHWWLGHRRERFPALSVVPEALVLLLVVRVAPGDPVLPLFAVTFRLLYTTLAPAIGLWALSVAALYGASALEGALSAGEHVGRAVGLAVAGGLAHVLAGALRRYERAERRLRAILEHSSDIVTIVGPELDIRWQGPSIRQVLGHEPGQLVGTSFLELVHPDDGHAVERLLELAAPAPGTSGTIELRLRDARGGYRHVEAVVGNRFEDPHIEGYLLNLRDASERRRLEAERAALTAQRTRDEASRVEVERLRERVEAQREKQELEARLRRSQRLESVGQLAGGVAHDFNNLLAIILNYAAFLREELPEDAALRDDLREIEQAAERGAALTRQLLLFSQRKVTSPKVLDLNAVIDGLDRLLTRSLGRQVALTYEQARDLWPVECDPVNVEQVLVNLVVNARDAVAGGGTIRVSTANVQVAGADAVDLELTPGPYVRLTVSDDGCGMDEATVARALEPFFTTKPTGQGTGLGLSTVYGVVAHAGGCVSLESEVGEGTAVAVYLPATVKARPEATAHPASSPAATGGGRVLVVEDEPALRLLVERILTKTGYTVVTAESGEQALGLWEADAAFDLVLSDIVMPGISGLELAAHLHARAPEQRILLMSGYSEELLARQGVDPESVLTKPFQGHTLRARVHEALTGRWSADVGSPLASALADASA